MSRILFCPGCNFKAVESQWAKTSGDCPKCGEYKHKVTLAVKIKKKKEVADNAN